MTDTMYIDMCEKAEEIQALAPSPKIIIFGGSDYYFHLDRDAPLVWLPNQKQLQEMVRVDGKSGAGRVEQLMWMFVLFADRGQWDYEHIFTSYAMQFTSMEQLWLAFVMKENYKKVWNGEEWIQESTP